MCLILDTNRFGDFVNPNNPDMEPIRKWINGNGKIVYSPTVKMKEELNRNHTMRTLLQSLRENNKAIYHPPEDVEPIVDELMDLQSNDPEIIALALHSGVKLLVSGDTDLHADFKSIVKGSIYQTRNHKHLLRPDTCP